MSFGLSIGLTQACLLHYVSILGQYWSHAGLSVVLCKYFWSVLVSADLSVVLHKSFGVSTGLIDAGLSVVLRKYFGVSIGLKLVCLLYYVNILGSALVSSWSICCIM